MRILGIDPGSRRVGIACIDSVGRNVLHVHHQTLKLNEKEAISLRLCMLFEGLNQIIHDLKPQALALEKVFFAKNPHSAFTLGYARGVALLVAAQHQLHIHEYTPTEVKRAIVGSGHAAKEEVAKLLQLTFGQKKFETHDASDALAIALCHALSGSSSSGERPKTSRRGRSLGAQLQHAVSRSR